VLDWRLAGAPYHGDPVQREWPVGEWVRQHLAQALVVGVEQAGPGGSQREYSVIVETCRACERMVTQSNKIALGQTPRIVFLFFRCCNR